MITSTITNLRRLSPQDEYQYFFGYYDVPAFSNNDQLHLAHRVQFWRKSTFTPLATTTAWNFQQGSMLQ